MEPRSQELDRAQALLKFTRRMSAMIDVGISLARCNATISADSLPPYSEFCEALQERWEQKCEITLSAAMAERPDLFSPFYVSSVHWGEIGGILEESFAQLAEILETTYRMWLLTGKRAEWAWALYPSEQSASQDWNALDEPSRTFVLMLFTRSMGQMLGAGVPFLSALNTAAEFIPVAQREEFRRGSTEFIMACKSWSEYLASSGIAPPFVTTMVGIGETTGTLDPILEKIAMVYQKQLECELM